MHIKCQQQRQPKGIKKHKSKKTFRISSTSEATFEETPEKRARFQRSGSEDLKRFSRKPFFER